MTTKYLNNNLNIFKHIKAPIHVDLEISGQCNYRCVFCESDMPYWSGKIRELPTKDYIKILDTLAEIGVFSIFLTGGEPLLNRNWYLIAKHAIDLSFNTSLSTNGVFLNKDNIDKLIKIQLPYIQVSLHGPPGIHEKVTKSKNTYNIVKANIKTAIEEGLIVQVAIVGLRENFEYIPQIIEDLATIGVRIFRILRFIPSHRLEMIKHVPDKHIVIKTIPKIITTAKEYNVRVYISTPPGLIEWIPYDVESDLIHPLAYSCSAGKTSLAILPSGDVYPCIGFRNRKEMYCGNILKDTFEEIWNAPPMVKLRMLLPNDYKGACGDCRFKWVCYSCRAVAYNLNGDIYGEDASCYFVIEKYIKKLIKS